MKRPVLEALMKAHGRRAPVVANLHVLRQRALSADDEAFLVEYAGSLGELDTTRWRALSSARRAAAVAGPPAPVGAAASPAPTPGEGTFDFSVAWADLFDGGEGDDASRPAAPPEASHADVAPRGAATTGDAPAPRGVGAIGDAAAPSDASAERVARLAGSGDVASLLDAWGAAGVARSALVGLAIRALEAGGPSRALVAWAGRQSGRRAALEAHGADLARALMRHAAWSELNELFVLAWSEASRGEGASADGPSAGFRQAAHGALAAALARRAAEALAAGAGPAALAALAALHCLAPPGRLSRAVRDLRRLVPAEGPAAELLDAAAELARRPSGRDATLASLVAAVHVLADAAR